VLGAIAEARRAGVGVLCLPELCLTGYGCEDTDLGRTVVARGLGLGWTGDARAYHQHHPVSDPPVEHLGALLRNARTFHGRWGEWPARGWFEAFEALGLVRRVGEGWEAVTRAPV